MKLFRTVLVAFAAILMATPMMAQQHVIKLTPGKLVGPINNVMLGYEYVVSDKVTVGADIKIALPRSVSSVAFDLDSVAATESGTFETLDLNSGFSFTPQVRFYLGNSGAPTGFYLNPWLRFFTYKFASDVKWEEPAGVSDITAEATYGGFGGGFSIGWQWLLGESVVIDWNMGLGVLPSRIGLSGSVSGPLATDVQDFIDEVNQGLTDAPLINGQIDGSSEGIDGMTNYFTMPVFRSNLSIGYAF